MEQQKIELLKKNVQDIIDLISEKRYDEAMFQHSHTCEILDEILDYTSNDDDIIEISRYQVLLNQLQLKIRNSLFTGPASQN
jgi:hypothetical protein